MEKEKNNSIGKVTHYFSNLGVGIIEVSKELHVGDQIKIQGHSTDISQSVDSIQIDHKEVTDAKKGDVVGIKVNDKVREGDLVYLKE